MFRGIGEGPHNFQKLKDRPWPSVRHNQRHRIVMRRADVGELNVETLNLGDKLWQGIQFRFRLPPVVIRTPVLYKRLQFGELDALTLVWNGFLIWPTGGS